MDDGDDDDTADDTDDDDDDTDDDNDHKNDSYTAADPGPLQSTVQPSVQLTAQSNVQSTVIIQDILLRGRRRRAVSLNSATPDRRQGQQQDKNKTSESLQGIRGDPRKPAGYQGGPAEAYRVSGRTLWLARSGPLV